MYSVHFFKFMSTTGQICRFHTPTISGSKKRSNWMLTEPFFNQIWFIAEVRASSDANANCVKSSKTIFLSRFEQVQQIAETQPIQEHRLLYANIATPSYINGTPDWRVDRLTKVWSAIEPLMPSMRTLVYETCTGDRFSCSQFDSETKDLEIESLVIELPNLSNTPT